MSALHRTLIDFAQQPGHNRNLQVLQNARSFVQTQNNLVAPAKSPSRSSSALCQHRAFLLVRQLLHCDGFYYADQSVCLPHSMEYIQLLSHWFLRLLAVWGKDQLVFRYDCCLVTVLEAQSTTRNYCALLQHKNIAGGKC